MESSAMVKPHAYNPVVLIGKTLFLQRVQEAVGAGYQYHIGGTIELDRSPSLTRKFASTYLVHVDKNERFRRKAGNFGNARLLLRLNEAQSIDYLLLVTPGEHPAHQLERLKDAGRVPLTYREFELVRLTLKGRQKPSLTWRLNAETVEAWKQRLHLHTAHYDRNEIFRDWYSLYRTPGFGGVRRQVGDLVAYWRRDWIKLRGNAPCPMSFPHNEGQSRKTVEVVKGEDGMYWTRRGFPNIRQLPKLLYVRKQSDVGEKLLRLVSTIAASRADAQARRALAPEVEAT